MRNAHCNTWNMKKKKKENMENEKCTLNDMEYSEKNTEKRGK